MFEAPCYKFKHESFQIVGFDDPLTVREVPAARISVFHALNREDFPGPSQFGVLVALCLCQPGTLTCRLELTGTEAENAETLKAAGVIMADSIPYDVLLKLFHSALDLNALGTKKAEELQGNSETVTTSDSPLP